MAQPIVPVDTLNIILNAVAGATAFATAFALLSLGKQNRQANRLLAAMLACIGFTFIESAVFFNASLIALLRWDAFFNWVMPSLSPFMWLYVRALTEPKFRFNRLDALHFLPALFLGFYGGWDAAEIPLTLEELRIWYTPERRLISQLFEYGVMTQILIYLFWAWRRLLRHWRAMRQLTADAELRDLHWLRRCLLGLSMMWLIWVFDAQNEALSLFTPIASLLYTLCLYYVGYHALLQMAVFQNLSTVDLPLLETLGEAPDPQPPGCQTGTAKSAIDGGYGK